jgi:hypothetical protein
VLVLDGLHRSRSGFWKRQITLSFAAACAPLLKQSGHLVKAANSFNQILCPDCSHPGRQAKKVITIRFNQTVDMIGYLSVVITALKRKIG